MHVAAVTQQPYAVLRLLVDAGCDPLATNRSGSTCFHQFSNEPVRRLLAVTSYPVDPYEQDSDGMTIMHYLSYSKTTRPDTVGRLLKNNISCLAVRDCLGRSPVDLAAARGNTSLVSHYFSLDGVASSCLAGENAVRLLNMAARSKRTDVYTFIIHAFVQIAAGGSHGWPAIHPDVANKIHQAIENVLSEGRCGSTDENDKIGLTTLDVQHGLTREASVQAESTEWESVSARGRYLRTPRGSVLVKVSIIAVLLRIWVWAYLHSLH